MRPSSAKQLSLRASLPSSLFSSRPAWFSEVCLCKGAYRQGPVHPEHLCVTCTAYWTTKHVNTGSGLALWLILCCSLLPGHRTSWLLYVDECAALLFFSFSMIVESPVWSVQRALHKPRCGLALDWQVQSWILPTRRPPAACRVFLGLSVNVALVSVRGFVSFDLKPGYREALSDEKKSVLAAGRLNSGRASKTFKASRALGWVSTGTCGRCGRALLAPLVTRQFTDSCDQLTPALTHCLQSTFSHASEKVVPPRLVRLSPLPTKPTRIYSDASYELLADVPAHLRFVIFAADASRRPVGMCLDISDDIFERFRCARHKWRCGAPQRSVFPAGTGRRVACQLLMKGASRLADLSILAAVTQLMFACVGCWFTSNMSKVMRTLLSASAARGWTLSGRSPRVGS